MLTGPVTADKLRFTTGSGLTVGLDMANVEGSAGMSDGLRDFLADVLTELADDGKIDPADAGPIAESVLSGLPRKLFGRPDTSQP